jgi:hypothetical protein
MISKNLVKTHQDVLDYLDDLDKKEAQQELDKIEKEKKKILEKLSSKRD